jgi:1-acyl-sn-glycerol-3-phosphate acyltransferase
VSEVLKSQLAEVKAETSLRDPNEPTFFWHFFRACTRFICTMMFGLKVYNIGNVPPTGGLLMLSNHQSFADPVLVAVRLRRPVAFLARLTLFKNSAFRWLIRSLNAVPVNKGAGDVGAMKLTISLAQSGWAVNIFPEGTRTIDGELQPIAKGAALVVKRARVPVVCCCIAGAYQAWPKGKKMFHAQQIRVNYSPPMMLHDLKSEEIIARVDA